MSDLNSLVNAVLEAKTNDFAELCKIAGIDMRTELAGADLAGTDLRRADLRHADLRQVNLSAADLRYANLSYANLENADLRFADLRHSVLVGANLSGARLEGAQMTETLRDSEELDPEWPSNPVRKDAPEVSSVEEWRKIVARSLHEQGPKLLRWIAARVRNPDDRAEIYQDVSLRLLKTSPIERYMTAAALPMAFLQKMASTVLAERKKEDRHELLEEDVDLTRELGTDSDPALILERQDVLRAVGSLPDVQRKIWELSFVKGLSRREIAGALGLQEETVNKHLRSALEQIQKVLLEK